MSDQSLYATGTIRSPVRAVVVARPAWQADAACLEHAEVDFFAEAVDRARSVCERCLVKQECLAFAIDTRTEFGVFGGMTPDERRKRWPPPPPVEHGTRRRYEAGCRCERCRDANTTYHRAARERRANAERCRDAN